MAATMHIAGSLSELVTGEHARHLGLDTRSLVDPWGTKLRYQPKGGIISCAGPDMTFGTKDDLVIISYNYRATTGKIQPDKIEWDAEQERAGYSR
jgi:hypothetical protein